MKFNNPKKSSYLLNNEYSLSSRRSQRVKFPRWLVLLSTLILITLVFAIYSLLSSSEPETQKPDEIIKTPVESAVDFGDNIYTDSGTNKTTRSKTPDIESQKLHQTTSSIDTNKIISTTPSSIKSDSAPTKQTPPLPIIEQPKLLKNKVSINSGDNLAAIFSKQDISSKILHQIVNNTKDGKKLIKIKPGQTLIFTFENKSKLTQLSFVKTILETLHYKLNKETNTFESFVELKEVDKRQKYISVTIQGSLFLSSTKQGLSDNLTMRIAQLFAWDIDFALDIRNGDSFSVLLNENFLDGQKISDGEILVAEFINKKDSYHAILYEDKKGKKSYYDVKGYNKRKAFLRTPVAFTRISSKFSSGRRHPVLNRIRAHKGVDYAAPRGTAIKSVGDGKVVFKGRKGGYGRVLQIQHGSRYMTVYAHLNSYNKKIRHGSRVKQGQTIAYVGSSGLATGPHLHYEFRVNGVHRNPLTVKLPKTTPLSKKYITDFKSKANVLLSKLERSKSFHSDQKDIVQHIDLN